MQHEFNFSVDTHLFSELGELLVGRDSTALVELIKNAYDADATKVTVEGQDLLGGGGVLTITDDGVGMTPEVFNQAFLRIAGRYKAQGRRTSPLFKRRYTGAKGVGRLSAHKLAERLQIYTIPYSAPERPPGEPLQGVSALIDWQAMEDDHATLEDVGTALNVTPIPASDQSRGTQLRLDGTRTPWTKQALNQFVREVAACMPPSELLAPPPFLQDSNGNHLGTITPWSRWSEDPGFTVDLRGDLEVGDDLWPLMLSRTSWLLEVEATQAGVIFNINPSPSTVTGNPAARSYQLRRDHPDPVNGPFFVARIYSRDGSWGKELTRFVAGNTGIRVYLEGFRVVPYGDRNDDWLGLKEDYVRRTRELRITLDEASDAQLPEQQQEEFAVQGPQQYIGGVFLTAAGAACLRPVVNREGFLRDNSFEILQELVRNGVDLLTRARVAAEAQKIPALAKQYEDALEDANRQADKSSKTDNSLTSGSPTPATESALREVRSARRNLDSSLSQARQSLDRLRDTVTSGTEVAEKLEVVSAAVDLARHSARQERADQAMLEVLASVGLQFSAFIHEVNGLLSQAQAIRTLASQIDLRVVPPEQRSLVTEIRSGLDILVQTLARQASYLTEVVGPDARRRRRRIPLSQAPAASLRLLAGALTERGIDVINEIDENVRTPPVFLAELTIIYTNLLTNAIKAVGANGRILLSGSATGDRGVVLRVENTGAAVDLEEAERWFQPFETTTTQIDIVLGQGMGLGLPITRRIVTEYNGTVKFVPPSPGYRTAVEVIIPGR
ncbi:ATP-binding protein [Spirillospora sp. NPDC048911]|uniref:ATP-binding protein n=1 Tax=Spirillospora sp. NPDC048911 TaxID=3364527 RepID=UPI0037135F51